MDDIMSHLLHIYSNCYADKTICKENALNSISGETFSKESKRTSRLGESAASTTEWNKKCWTLNCLCVSALAKWRRIV